MTDIDAVRLREDFLTRLDAAMRTVPYGMAREIHAAITEELRGLDAEATATLIARLGEPEDIAREAAAETSDAAAAQEPPVLVVSPAVKTPATETKGFAIVAALVIGFGGIAVPIAGWFVGAVLVVLSALWYRWEKIIAIALPFIVLALFGIVGVISWLSWSDEAVSEDTDAVNNPLIPGIFDFAFSGVVLSALIIVPVSGLWLLWRLRGRTSVSR